MERFSATYRLSVPADQARERAEGVALEQSLELPLEAVTDPWILDHVAGRVESLVELPSGGFETRISYAVESTGFSPAQLCNVLFGNSSLQPGVELTDFELPDSLLAAFAGPLVGSRGLRQLVGADRRPLTCTALKPQGSSVEQLAQLAHTFALAGIDLIKDDHGVADQSYAPFAPRLEACHQAVEAANRITGRKSCYVPNLMAGSVQVRQWLYQAREVGVRMVMMAPAMLGLPSFAELAGERVLPILGHPALAGWRKSPQVVLGKLFRLFGADAAIFPNFGGRFAYSRQECSDLAQALRQPWGEIRPALPTPAGGMSVARVEEMVEFYGREVILLIGGGLLTAREQLLERSQQFVQKVESMV